MANRALTENEQQAKLEESSVTLHSGVEYLAQLFVMMDRQSIFYPILQGIFAGVIGYGLGTRIETSGWLVGAGGDPLDGEISFVLAVFMGLSWWFTLGMLFPAWRQAFFQLFIPQFNSTYLIYLVLEHRPHERIAPFLARDPIFPWVRRIRTHEPFAKRIRSFINSQPEVCRGLAMQDYPGHSGKLLFAATALGALLAILAVFATSQIIQSFLVFGAWLLLSGALAFRQARIQALSYTLASFFVRWLDAY